MPTYLLQWEAMRWAKAKGCTTYDLWGVRMRMRTPLKANLRSVQMGCGASTGSNAALAASFAQCTAFVRVCALLYCIPIGTV